ncbi:MAG: energy transducer TonB [Bradyrhizobiaceae bacterium]|nr:MAG: energy transducer TonB [Bradyrhizobiaceae bacterium]
MTTLAFHGHIGQHELQRWGIAAAIVLAVHAVLIAGYFVLRLTNVPSGAPLEAISIDLAPSTASPERQTADVAPGPTMKAADAPAPEPQQQKAIEEIIAPTPPQENPAVLAAPEQKAKPEPVRETPKPAVKQPPKKSSDKPAPRTSAAPRADRQASAQEARSGASAAAALATYRQRLNAHLQRFKGGGTGASGSVTAMFTVSRGGGVLGIRLARSSGNPALDNEALSTIRRAQPLPPIPPEIPQSSLTFPVPFSFGR